MNITTAQIKEIKTAFAKLKPVKVTLDGNRSLTVKEAIRALAPTLERMKKRGFDTQEIAEKLHEKGLDIKPPTLAKYLNEFRRGKDRKTDTPPPPVETKKVALAPQPNRPATVKPGEFVITPDTPLDEL
ncbi:conserved hypothetical protein [uncultured delta proteobacterium]|uniref:Protein MobC n=1 Tax=uncultured delta proteobacterium TaxID=34034 RepID=A0A212K993_9DELT|nr:conserved hypothetical protein [uncultured delta proteobacterium]